MFRAFQAVALSVDLDNEERRANKNLRPEGDGEEAQPRKVVTVKSSRPREWKTTERKGSRRNDQGERPANLILDLSYLLQSF